VSFFEDKFPLEKDTRRVTYINLKNVKFIMKNLKDSERRFLVGLLKYKPQKRGGYFNFNYGKKHYRRSRVLIQLHLNKKLEIWEVVHHKDGNKENDFIENLEVIDTSKHTSYHHAGSKKKYIQKNRRWNKISEYKIKKIFELAEIHKFGGKPNFSKIGMELGISGFTVSKYLNLK